MDIWVIRVNGQVAKICNDWDEAVKIFSEFAESPLVKEDYCAVTMTKGDVALAKKEEEGCD